MRILYLLSAPFTMARGAPLVARQTVEHLLTSGHEVDLLCFPIGSDIELPGLRITRCGKWLNIRRIGLGASWKKAVLDVAIIVHLLIRMIAWRLRLVQSYDLILALDEISLPCGMMRRLLGCPIIYDMDTSLSELFESHPVLRNLLPFAKWAEIKMVRNAGGVIVQCQAYAKLVCEIDPQKTVVVVPDAPMISAEAVDSAIIPPRLVQLTRKSPIILYVGNLGLHQGIKELLGAFRLITEASVCANLVIAGGNAHEVKSLSKKYSNVVFLGTVQPADLPSLYRIASVVVSPRQSGRNVPMKIYDYMLSGRVIVATNLETHRQVLDSSCAILVEPDEQGLAFGIRSGLEDEPLAKRLASAARAKVSTLTSAELFGMGINQAIELSLRYKS